MPRFKKKAKIFDIAITAVAGMVSVGVMLYAVFHLGVREAWPELVLNLFYIACLVMIWMYFFNLRITIHQFNYWCSLLVGITVLLRDILFPPPLAFYSLHLVCLVLSVLLLCMLTFFYARKNWESYNATCGLSASSTYSLPHYIITTSTLSPSTNTPTICSPKSGYVPPSPTDW